MEFDKEKAKEVGRKFMGFLDMGVEASKKGLQSAGQAINEFGDKSVNQFEISKLNGKIEKIYREIGEMIFEKADSGSGPVLPEDVTAKISEIKKLKDDILVHEQKIRSYDNKGAREPEPESASEKPAAETKGGSETGGE